MVSIKYREFYNLVNNIIIKPNPDSDIRTLLDISLIELYVLLSRLKEDLSTKEMALFHNKVASWFLNNIQNWREKSINLYISKHMILKTLNNDLLPYHIHVLQDTYSPEKYYTWLIMEFFFEYHLALRKEYRFSARGTEYLCHIFRMLYNPTIQITILKNIWYNVFYYLEYIIEGFAPQLKKTNAKVAAQLLMMINEINTDAVHIALHHFTDIGLFQPVEILGLWWLIAKQPIKHYWYVEQLIEQLRLQKSLEEIMSLMPHEIEDINLIKELTLYNQLTTLLAVYDSSVPFIITEYIEQSYNISSLFALRLHEELAWLAVGDLFQYLINLTGNPHKLTRFFFTFIKDFVIQHKSQTHSLDENMQATVLYNTILALWQKHQFKNFSIAEQTNIKTNHSLYNTPSQNLLITVSNTLYRLFNTNTDSPTS